MNFLTLFGRFNVHTYIYMFMFNKRKEKQMMDRCNAASCQNWITKTMQAMQAMQSNTGKKKAGYIMYHGVRCFFHTFTFYFVSYFLCPVQAGAVCLNEFEFVCIGSDLNRSMEFEFDIWSGCTVYSVQVLYRQSTRSVEHEQRNWFITRRKQT